MRERSWPPSGPLTPGDALDTGRVDARRLLRPPPLAASRHAYSQPRGLWRWRLGTWTDVDVVIATVGGETLDRSFAILTPGGKIVLAVSA
jgi:hypothetical protein